MDTDHYALTTLRRYLCVAENVADTTEEMNFSLHLLFLLSFFFFFRIEV